MKIEVSRAQVQDILRWRDLYKQELNCQIVHNSWHERGRTEIYLITANDAVAGYGALAQDDGRDGRDQRGGRGTVMEFYTLPCHRPAAHRLFRELLVATGAAKVRAQTNDVLLTLMLYDFTKSIKSETILFEDALTTQHHAPPAVFRKMHSVDQGHIFDHHHEPVGDWLLEVDNTIVATGGALFHYNRPYGDIFMEVDAAFRQRGYGSYLVQELKRVTYEMGSVPAARCDVTNLASRYTLQKAGFVPCARILTGQAAL